MSRRMRLYKMKSWRAARWHPLVTVGNAADLETQRCIAYALCNLSVDEARRPTIVDEGGLPPIISLACSRRPPMSKRPFLH